MTVLILSVARGLIPLTFGSSALSRPTYTMSFILGLFLSFPGLYWACFKRTSAFPKNLRLLLLTNLLLIVIWWIPIVTFNREPNFVISLAYAAIFPFSIYGFFRIPEKHLTAALALVTTIIACSVIWDFIELNTSLIPGGYDLAVARQMVLRPDTFMAFGGTGDLRRAVGIFGDRPHDAGNLLAVLSIYWIARLFRTNDSKLAICLISALSIPAMLMTQSASNIAAFFVGLIFVTAGYRKSIPRAGVLRTFLAAAGVGACVLYVFTNFLEINPTMLWRWSERIGPGGAWKEMTALGITNPGVDLLTALIGHGSSLEFSRVGSITELGFLKILMEYGLPTCAVFLALLFYPVWRYFCSNSPDKRFSLPYVAPVLVGFVSLWHYGSVLRTTNIFVFFALYAHALNVSGNGSRAPGNPGSPSKPSPS